MSTLIKFSNNIAVRKNHCISKIVILPKQLWNIVHNYNKNHFNKYALIFKAVFKWQYNMCLKEQVLEFDLLYF